MKKKSSLTILLILIVVLSLTLVACQETTVEQLQNDHGVTVEGGVFDKDAVLVTTKVESTSAEGKQVLETIADVDYDKNADVYIFDLYITNDGVKVQPDGKVKVTIPLPDQSITACKVLHIKENNQVETLIPTIANGKLSFETSSFSYFVLVQENTNEQCNHTFGEWETAIEATCQQDGQKFRTCRLCKEQEFETIPALGHDVVQHQGKDATCLEAGYKAYETCSRCNYTTYEEIPALGHDLTQHQGKDATCLEAGYKAYETCSRCDHTTYEEIKALGHDLTQHPGKDATCLEAGYKPYEDCSRCDYTTYEEIPALGHDLTQHQGKDATCLEAGYKPYETCSRCDHTTYEEIPALGHDLTQHQVKEATCLEAGYKAYETCSRCDYTTYQEIKALGHAYSDWNVIKEPTCTEAGLRTSVCSRCNNTIEETLPAKAHVYGPWQDLTESTCATPGTRERSCVICSAKETGESPLADHSYGDWRVEKQPTLEEEGIERNYCTVCGAYQEYVLDKLTGYTVIVSGGTVNRKGESKQQSSIYVGEGETVVISANEYAGYTFMQWQSDGSEIIPTSTFELNVSRSCAFYICFEEGLDYGNWTLEQEKTCTQDGIYSRTDATTGLKQYMLIPSRGHEMQYETVVEIEPTCTTSGREVSKCYLCDYEEVSEISPLGHDFSGKWVIIEEAHGSKIGTKEISCTRCDAKTTKQYMDAVYPTGNIKVEFVWDHRSYVSSADRTEIHWQLDENKYCFYVMRESSGHSSGNYVHFYFYYEDNGPHSPVYIKKMVGDKYYTQYNQYGSYGWGIVGYVDSFDDFVEYIDSAMKGNDNGLNNSGLHTVYQMWEDIFNERGCIPSSYYCDGIVEYCGYTCTVYSNGDFYYYVTEDNCCLSYGGLGSNRDQAYVEKIEAITKIPHGPVDYDQVKYIMINIEDGDEDKFTDQYYFQVENLNQRVEIYEDRYISKRLDVAGYEVQLADGTWAKIEELTQSGNWWKGDETFTYMSIVEKYLDGKYPDCLEIRAIKVDAPLPVHVKVINGTVSSNADYMNYGSENDFPANEEICFNPEYDESKYTVMGWIFNINGEIIEEEDRYLYNLVLPESGTVIAECILKEYGASSDGVRVTINVVGNGTLSHETGSYPEFDILTISANAQRKQIFIGWFVQGLSYRSEGDDYPSGSFNEDYYQYGDFFGNKPVFNFSLADRYDEVVITAIFEEVSADTNYIDIIIQDGFVSTYAYKSLTVSALRLTEPDSLSIYGLFTEEQNISGWIVTEQTEEGPVQTQLDGKFTSYYFTVDSTLTPIEATEGEGE